MLYLALLKKNSGLGTTPRETEFLEMIKTTGSRIAPTVKLIGENGNAFRNTRDDLEASFQAQVR